MIVPAEIKLILPSLPSELAPVVEEPPIAADSLHGIRKGVEVRLKAGDVVPGNVME